jgi:bifunctional non-homologous end joining protein LigD
MTRGSSHSGGGRPASRNIAPDALCEAITRLGNPSTHPTTLRSHPCGGNHREVRGIVRRDGHAVRLYTRNAYDWTVRLPAIAAAAARIKAKSFTIDGEAVVQGPDGLSRFDELRRREAAHNAMLYAFDLIERDGQDLRVLPFLDRKAALARLLRSTDTHILFNEHVAGDGPTVLEHSCRLGAEGIVSKRIDGTYRSAVPCLDQGPESRHHCGTARSEKWNR